MRYHEDLEIEKAHHQEREDKVQEGAQNGVIHCYVEITSIVLDAVGPILPSDKAELSLTELIKSTTLLPVFKTT